MKNIRLLSVGLISMLVQSSMLISMEGEKQLVETNKKEICLAVQDHPFLRLQDQWGNLDNITGNNTKKVKNKREAFRNALVIQIQNNKQQSPKEQLFWQTMLILTYQKPTAIEPGTNTDINPFYQRTKTLEALQAQDLHDEELTILQNLHLVELFKPSEDLNAIYKNSKLLTSYEMARTKNNTTTKEELALLIESTTKEKADLQALQDSLKIKKEEIEKSTAELTTLQSKKADQALQSDGIQKAIAAEIITKDKEIKQKQQEETTLSTAIAQKETHITELNLKQQDLANNQVKNNCLLMLIKHAKRQNKNMIEEYFAATFKAARDNENNKEIDAAMKTIEKSLAKPLSDNDKTSLNNELNKLRQQLIASNRDLQYIQKKLSRINEEESWFTGTLRNLGLYSDFKVAK